MFVCMLLLFLSPIFKKKASFPLGLHKVKVLVDLFDGLKIALGGINEKNIKLLNLSKFNGFAAVQYFDQKKRPPEQENQQKAKSSTNCRATLGCNCRIDSCTFSYPIYSCNRFLTRRGFEKCTTNHRTLAIT